LNKNGKDDFLANRGEIAKMWPSQTIKEPTFHLKISPSLGMNKED
jgi:hypothetical protein